MEAIVADSKNGALACFIGDQIGTFEPDKIADIIVIDGNPLTECNSLVLASHVNHKWFQSTLCISG